MITRRMNHRFVGAAPLLHPGLGLFIGGLLLAGGCSSWSMSHSQQASAGLTDAQAQIAQLTTQVDSTLASLKVIESAQNLNSSYNSFITELSKMQAQADSLNDHAADMRAQGNDYVKKWQDEEKNLTDPDLKASTEQRRAAVQADYAKLGELYAAAQDSAKTFMVELNNLKVYLSNDLSAAAIPGAVSAIDKAGTDGAILKEKASAVSVQLSTMQAGGAQVPNPPPSGSSSATPSAPPSAPPSGGPPSGPPTTGP
jgi:hypothetical protein